MQRHTYQEFICFLNVVENQFSAKKQGQADRAEERRILAELPRLARSEGLLWAPSDDVLARVAFPRIRSFDGSRTPERLQRGPDARVLAVVDLSALAAAPAEMEG